MAATCEHRNNPTGASTTSSVATAIACTPIDPAGQAIGTARQDFPTEKLFLFKECYTKYAGFATGDFLVSDGVTYAVRSAQKWAAQGGLDVYYALILEEQLGS